MYSSYSFITSTLDGGEWSASRPGRALPPRKGPPVPIVQEAGWAPELVWTQRIEEKSSASVGDRTPVVQSVVSQYTDWATPAPLLTVMVAMMIMNAFQTMQKHRLPQPCYQLFWNTVRRLSNGRQTGLRFKQHTITSGKKKALLGYNFPFVSV
jgi:hypothetical protein